METLACGLGSHKLLNSLKPPPVSASGYVSKLIFYFLINDPICRISAVSNCFWTLNQDDWPFQKSYCLIS